MSSVDFDAIVNKFLTSDCEAVLEAGMKVFDGIQKMDAAKVVSFWRTLISFYQAQKTETERVIGRQMLEAAYERMRVIDDETWTKPGKGLSSEITAILGEYKYRKDT